MTLSAQKNREYAHLLAFKESIPDFPQGQISLDEEHPDFLIHSGSETIGIEHTEVYHEPRSDGSFLQAKETYAHQILRRAKEIHGDRGGKPALVSLSLSHGVRLNKARVEPLAATLADVVQSQMPLNQRATEVRQTWRDDSLLPLEFSSLTIFCADSLQEPVWGPIMDFIAVPDIPSALVLSRINQKNAKVGKYRAQCDEVWLLIVVDGFRQSTWFDVSGEALRQTYQSNFDRTYLFDFQKRQAVRLSTQIPRSP